MVSLVDLVVSLVNLIGLVADLRVDLVSLVVPDPLGVRSYSTQVLEVQASYNVRRGFTFDGDGFLVGTLSLYVVAH